MNLQIRFFSSQMDQSVSQVWQLMILLMNRLHERHPLPCTHDPKCPPIFTFQVWPVDISSSNLSWIRVTWDYSRSMNWVCLKMGYTPNYSHLVGIMIINHWVEGYTIFRQTQFVFCFDQNAVTTSVMNLLDVLLCGQGGEGAWNPHDKIRYHCGAGGLKSAPWV